jgi:Flp pilus assembly protein TadG
MRKSNQRGSVLIFLTLAFALLGTFIGFAVDFGRAYLQKARISRLVDGAALAAAKVLKGQASYEAIATALPAFDGDRRKVATAGGNTCEATTTNLTVTLEFPRLSSPGRPANKSVLVQALNRCPQPPKISWLDGS